MEMKFLLIADTANSTPEGKLNIAGEFNTVFGTQTPIVWPYASIVARLEANPGEGRDHAAQLKLTDEDGKQLFASPPMPITFGPGGRGIPARANIIVAVGGLTFPRFGDYTIALYVDGVSRGDMTIYVRDRPLEPADGGGRRIPKVP